MSAIAAVIGKLGADAEGVLSRLGGELGEAARIATAALATLDAGARKTQRARWMASARIAVPEGFRLIHPTWIEAALVELPTAARDAVANLATSPTEVWLARTAMAGLVAMPQAHVVIAKVPAELPALAPEALQVWLERAGADQLARSAQLAGGELRKLAEGDPRVREAQERIALPPRVNQFGRDRAVVERCTVVPHDETRFLRIGARAVAAHLAPLVRQQIVQRLPRALGVAVRVELNRPANSMLVWIP
ncbi:hypothetical protein BH11MYX1_BH11MYX1_58160 [soil metagenome]